MKKISHFSKSDCISTKEMRNIKGGKKIIQQYLNRDSEGSYWTLVYDDGTTEFIPLSWYA